MIYIIWRKRCSPATDPKGWIGGPTGGRGRWSPSPPRGAKGEREQEGGREEEGGGLGNEEGRGIVENLSHL